ncbi:MAG TPA: hypothetical protein PKN23_02635 [Candidatus Hydrogenedentes bacterium]|nr:hypothetical protein [Candidatus Hydrogenedentota bacterium]
MESDIRTLIEELTQEQRQLDEWSSSALTSLEEQVRTLRAQAGRLAAGRRDAAADPEALAALTGERDRLVAELDGARGAAAETAAALEGLRAELDALRAAAAEKDGQLAELDTLRATVIQQNADLDELDGLRGRLAELEGKLREAEGLQSRISELEAAAAEADALRAELEASRSENAETATLYETLAAAQARLAELSPLEQRTAALRAASEEAAREAETLRASLAEAAAAAESARAETVQAQERAAELERAAAESAAAQNARIAELESALAGAPSGDDALRSAQERAAALEAELGALAARLEAREENLAKLELEKKMLLGQVEGLNLHVSEAAESRTRIAKLEAELEVERTRVLRLRAQLEAHKPARPTVPRHDRHAGSTPLEDQISAPFESLSAGGSAFVSDDLDLPPLSPDLGGDRLPADLDLPPLPAEPRGRAEGGRGRRPRAARKQLGEILVEADIITQAQLEEAIRLQAADPKRRLGAIVVEQGYTTEEAVGATLAAQLRTRYVDNLEREMTPDAMRMVPQNVAVKHRCVPLVFEGGTLTVAMANPLDLIALEDLQHATGAYIEAAVATNSAIDRVLAKYYSGKTVTSRNAT